MPRKPRSGTGKRSGKKGGGRRKKKNGVSVDFTGVEGRVLVPEGEYLVKVAEVTEETGSESGEQYLAWKFLTIDDEVDNKPLFYNTSLQDQALWNLRNVLEALEVEVPDGPMDIDFDELIDLQMVAVVEHETVDGKRRSRLVDFMSADEGSEEGGEEVTVDKGKKGDEDEELEPLSEDEVSEMSVEELQEVVEKYGLDVDLSKLKTARKKVNAILDALEENNHLAEED